MDKIIETRYVITNEEENKFFKSSKYFLESLIDSDLFIDMEGAAYYLKRALNQFQKKIFTKIIAIKITIERG
jgi:hypothetical protein